VQQSWSEYPDFADYLTELGFSRLVLGTRNALFKSKFALAWHAIRASIRLWRHRRALEETGIVVVFGHFAWMIKLFARLHLIRYKELFCFAFFVHAPAWFPVFRWLGRLDTERDHYLIFSRSEMKLYADRLGIDRKRMHYLPYGDWSRVSTASKSEKPELIDYYFSGGYCNRDYVSLIDAFRGIAASLVIACSSLNKELDCVPLPPNVRVLRDVPSPAFEGYIQRARAGIIWLKHDTGASGQSVMLRFMRNAKVVIASDVGAMREYVETGVSGYLTGDLAGELPNLIAKLESDPAAASVVGQRARDKYLTCFSRNAISEAFNDILVRALDPSLLPADLRSSPEPSVAVRA
jgi:glycosyltransferase involved in cell wall biosynthesis